MENKKSIGLPGGPNEFLKDITQYISIEGYKRYSKDINNPVNIIESGSITMEDVDFPVMGTDNLGNSQMMMPGNNYQFPGDQVFEVPMAQYGLSTMQDKVLTKEEEEDIKNYRGYINSDLFKNRVSLVGNDPKEVQTKYLNNLDKIKYSEDADYLEPMNSHGTITYDRSDTKKDSDGFKYISNINAILHPDRGRGIALHETDHGTTQGNKDLNTDQIIDIVRGQGLTKERLENFKLLGNSYNVDSVSARGLFGNPSEIHSRISSTRKFLLDQGMHQEFGEDITDEQIEKLWKQKENSNFWIRQRHIDVQDLMRTSANKGNFKRLMNEVAYNDLPSVTNNIRMAQDGTEIPDEAEAAASNNSFLYDLEKLVNKSLGDINNKAKDFSENPEEMNNIDNMRHASGGRYAAEAIQQKVKDIPYLGGLLDFVGVDKAAGFIGSNVMGVGHELRTIFGGDERPFLAKLQEMGEDTFNNYVGSIVGSLSIDDSKKDEVIKYLSYNNLLPDGYVRTEQGKKDGFSEDIYFKDEDGKRKTAYQRGGGLLDKTMKCNSCGWSWKAADGGADVSTCHKCGGSALPKAQDGRETYTREQSIARQEQLIEYANEYFGGDINKAATALETGAVKGGMKFPEDAKILKTNYNKRIDNNSTGAGSAFLDAAGSVMNTTGGLMGEAVRSLKEGEKFKADRALGMHPTERQTDVAAELGIENPLAAFLVNVGSDPGTFLGAGAIRNTVKGVSKKGIKNTAKNPFKSEIDWGKWVRYTEDFDNNPDVIKHLYEIEQASKANGTWMKNFDGSDFKGTKEQFVVQQSDNWKKAYPEGAETTYRGGDRKEELNKIYDTIFTTSQSDAASAYNRRDLKILGDLEKPAEGLTKLYMPNTKNKIVVDGFVDVPGSAKDIGMRTSYGRLNAIDQVPANKIEAQNQDDFIAYMREKYSTVTPRYGETEVRKLNDRVMTDHYASFLTDSAKGKNVDRVDFKKIFDGSIKPIDVQVHNLANKNQIKSQWGNILLNLENPNIYKGMAPVGAAGALNNKEEMALGGAPQYQYAGETSEDSPISAFLNKTQGGQPTAQEGNGEYVLNNFQDFTITKQELDYLNDKDNNYCPGGNCLENTKNAFNKTAGTIPGVKDYYETWEKDLQATSQKNRPTQEQIEEMPWYKGDGNVASVDSWDVQGKIVDSGGTTVYNKNNSDSTYTPGKAAIGSIYSFGPSSRKDSGNKKRNQGYSKEFNLQPSHHSVSVVGFDDESNENILYDAYFREYLNESDLIKKWKDHGLNYELEAIGTPKNYTRLTRENLKENKYLKQDKTVSPYKLDFKKLQSLTEDNKVQYTERDSDGNASYRQPRFNLSAMKPFVNSLKKNKGVVMDVLNIGNSQYDELANLAVALAMGESEGGAGLSLDFLGETQGLTQLNYKNISKDEVLNKSLKKINSKLDKKERITDISSLRNPSKSAIASLLYLSKVKSRSKQAHEQGLNPSERTFYDNSNSLKETFRYSSAKINKDSFYVDAIGERIPFKDIPGWDNKDTKEVTNYLNTVSKSNDYIAKLDDKGKIAVTMKTKGNNPNLSLGKRIGYFWQSPNSLKTGDAQGDNVHASRINHYFNSINNLQSGDLIKAQLGNGEYKVLSGDTFYGIANKNNVTWDELKKANPNIGYNNLKLNQSIVIPKKIDKPANVIKRETVKESVQDFQITPQLLYKQAYVESNLNPKAKNSLGYMGLGQIGKSLINDYKKANKVDTVDPFDPKQNYDVQAWSMNELFNSSFIDKPGSTMENRLLKSLASYNWGRGNVLNLLKVEKAKGADIYKSTEWMQHLPKETREYIQMIVYNGKPEKRPLVQENFLKTTTDEKYKDLRTLYNYKQGGEPNLFNMYSGYINGDYDGTEFESKAALTYDKLNRVYYKEAKDAGMHVPNYIMTYVIGNS